MNREVSGVNGQFVTTWGSDLEPGTDRVVPGSNRPLTTTVTCRCGHSEKFVGWSSEVEKKTKFRVYSYADRHHLEYFCSRDCWIKFEPKQALNHIEWCNQQIENLKASIEITKEGLWET